MRFNEINEIEQYISFIYVHQQSGSVIKQYFLIEWDETDWERYLKKIPFHSFEQNRISQKLMPMPVSKC